MEPTRSAHVAPAAQAVPSMPPPPGGAWAWLERPLHAAFIQLNRLLMIPLHRAGLAAWIATPVGGYMLLLRVRGRQSGIVREIPLSYLVAEGSVWVLAGFGPRTQWYRNLLVHPEVEVRLPGRSFRAAAAEETDPAVRARIMPALARAAGLPGLMIGVNPWSAGDRAILQALDWVPLVGLDPAQGPVAAGSDDPGGRAWLWRQGLVVALVALKAWGVRWTLRRLRRVGR